MIDATRCLCIIATAAAGGCATPPAVYELADNSSANAAVFAEHLATLRSQSRTLAERRASHIASMDTFNAVMLAEYQRDVALTRRVGDWEPAKKIIDDLTALRDELERIHLSGLLSEATRRQEIMNNYVALEPNVRSVREVANALSALAERERRAERARFLAGFVRQVREEAKTTLAKEDALSKSASKLLDDAAGKLKPADKK